ncbi:hypothetical protein [Lactiplantibacillus fabifermentans]|uniref:Uncharacterized protein n=1 Tax=Lactiplantibacillus fabifermentans T30PCM01 TaxID=1400520 RepID=W6T9A6_9LACO|nr:hypothetical protein [Lactiplantibacillus fabifermentans]ETY75012.1 hypothetical protein LFAB_04165 [Lactiplantibacillus fabifermentans T30PCM01]
MKTKSKYDKILFVIAVIKLGLSLIELRITLKQRKEKRDQDLIA